MCELQYTLMLVDIQPLASASLQLGERSIQSRSKCDQLCTCCKTHVCTVMYNKLICRTACKYAAEGILHCKLQDAQQSNCCTVSHKQDYQLERSKTGAGYMQKTASRICSRQVWLRVR